MTELKKTQVADAVDQGLEINEYYGDKEVRWFQIAARNGVYSALEEGVKRILIHLPTGAGKTITIACTLDDPRIHEILGIEEDRPLRVLFFAHVHRLLTQAEETFAAANNVDIKICSAFTPVTDEEVQWADVAVIDEAHHEAMMSLQNQLDVVGELPIIGLTATPDRPDGMVIKFETIISPISRQEAVEQGYLAETSIFSFVDMSGQDKTEIVCDILTSYGHQMGQTMIFMKTRAEVQRITDHLIKLGYTAVGLINQTNKQMGDELDKFGRGEIQFIVNCAKIGEGVDVAGCTTVLLGRQLKSYTMLNQYIGRAARPDSDCNIYELINPLSGKNLDTTVVVGTPKSHMLINNLNGEFEEHEFDYVGFETGLSEGMNLGFGIG